MSTAPHIPLTKVVKRMLDFLRILAVVSLILWPLVVVVMTIGQYSHPETWGVDIGAAIAIHKALIALRDSGAAILVVSEDIDELFTISDRICALYHGQLSPAQPTADTTIEEVGAWMAGIFDEPRSAA